MNECSLSLSLFFFYFTISSVINLIIPNTLSSCKYVKLQRNHVELSHIIVSPVLSKKMGFYYETKWLVKFVFLKFFLFIPQMQSNPMKNSIWLRIRWTGHRLRTTAENITLTWPVDSNRLKNSYKRRRSLIRACGSACSVTLGSGQMRAISLSETGIWSLLKMKKSTRNVLWPCQMENGAPMIVTTPNPSSATTVSFAKVNLTVFIN